MTRDLAAPPWVDSVHHGMITRLILETGSYPASYLPYLDIDGARYHAGFHSLLATFLWLSGLGMQQGMLLFGQVLNALIVFPVYLLTVKLTSVRHAGLFAAIIAGLFTPMPAYYTSWGRYTQLVSLLALPGAFWLIQAGREKWSREGFRAAWKTLLLAGIACAGIFLTHYRVAAFLACLLVADFIIAFGSDLLRKAIARMRHTVITGDAYGPQKYILSVVVTAALALFLVLPWLPDTFSSLFIPKLTLWQGDHGEVFSGFAWSFLTTAWGKVSLYLAAFGLGWGILRKHRITFVIAAWSGLMFLIANLEPLGLPGGGFVTSLSVAITLFMPISVAGGFFIGDLYTLVRDGLESWSEHLPTWLPVVYRFIWVIATVIAMLAAGRALLPILRPVTFLARQADAAGLDWMAENTPAKAVTLINPTGWGYGLYQGQDGGYWLTPVSGRRTVPPPVLYGLDNNVERIRAMNRLVQSVIEHANDPAVLQAMLHENGINYIFLGARGGLLSPRLLNESGLFSLLFSQDGVWIFGVKP
jgi:hypothetical protein